MDREREPPIFLLGNNDNHDVYPYLSGIHQQRREREQADSPLARLEPSSRVQEERVGYAIRSASPENSMNNFDADHLHPLEEGEVVFGGIEDGSEDSGSDTEQHNWSSDESDESDDDSMLRNRW